MKKLALAPIYTVILMLAVLASCSPKVESPDPKPDPVDPGGGTTDPKALLTSHSWIAYDYKSVSSDPTTIPNGDFSSWPSCEKDNIWTYQASGIYVMDESGEKCDAGDPQVVSGNWSLNQPATELTMDGDIVKVIKLEKENLVLEFTTDFFGLVTVKETISYRKF